MRSIKKHKSVNSSNDSQNINTIKTLHFVHYNVQFETYYSLEVHNLYILLYFSKTGNEQWRPYIQSIIVPYFRNDDTFRPLCRGHLTARYQWTQRPRPVLFSKLESFSGPIEMPNWCRHPNDRKYYRRDTPVGWIALSWSSLLSSPPSSSEMIQAGSWRYSLQKYFPHAHNIVK
jgi:hypothetical protein